MEGIGNDDEKSQVETFISITSASREEALFFLESHNFQLDAAIHSFFENAAVPPSDDRHHRTQELGQDLDLEEVEEVPASASAAVPRPLIPATGSAMVGSREERNKKAASRASGSKGGGIRTLADLNRQPGPGSDSDSDGPQEYYTGGEKSGMLVQDPNRGPGNDVDAIFDQARQMGALQGPLDPHPSSSSRNFTGTGRLLSGETVPAAPRQPENVVHNINFWSNGFTVNDGPLRRFEDPANAAFLESIKKSECPKELEPEDRRSGVHVNLIRKGEDYHEPVKRLGPFQGVGRTLGDGSSSTDSVAREPSPAVSSPSPSPATATAALLVDDSLPTTSIQLRFADGSRMVARFNTHHTVGDIRSFINHHTASQGGSVPSTYRLQTVGFPPKQLTDTAQTIEEAGLANSVVIQKL